MLPRSARSRSVLGGGLLLSAVVFVIVTGGTASLVAGIVADGITPRAKGFLIGIGVVPLCLIALSIAFRECVRIALEHVRERSGVSEVFMLIWSGSYERSFRALGILPIWRVRLFAVSITPSGLDFWSGVRHPFAFAKIRGRDIAVAKIESIGLLGQRPQRVVVEVCAGNKAEITLDLEPLSVGKLIVTQGDPGETKRMHEALIRSLGR